MIETVCQGLRTLAENRVGHQDLFIVCNDRDSVSGPEDLGSNTLGHQDLVAVCNDRDSVSGPEDLCNKQIRASGPIYSL